MWKIIKTFCRNLLAQQHWALLSILSFISFIIFQTIIISDVDFFCNLGIVNYDDLVCVNDTYRKQSISIITYVSLALSVMFSFFAFLGDIERRRAFFKTLLFLIPILGLFVLFGFNAEFCFMFSCSNLGGLAIVIAVFFLIAFVLSLGFPMVGKFKYQNIGIMEYVLGLFVFFIFLAFGVFNIGERIEDHERDAEYSGSLNLKEDAEIISRCNKGLAKATEDRCLMRYAIRLHKEAVCDGLSTKGLSNSCKELVQCSKFHGYDNLWYVDKNKCGEQFK